MPAEQKELFFVTTYIQATRSLLTNDFDKNDWDPLICIFANDQYFSGVSSGIDFVQNLYQP